MFAKTNLRDAHYQAHSSMAAHFHGHASLNLVVDGAFLENIHASERSYEVGHVAFCPAGTTHSQQFGARGARQVILTPQPAWLEYLADCKINLECAPYARSASFHQMAGRLLDELRNDDDFSSLACEGIALEIVAAFGRRKTGDASGGAPPRWLSAARDFIHANALNHLDIEQIATAAGRHEIHLAREFRRFFGVSIGAYQRRLRAERAAALLSQTRVDISEVALECGFAGHSHLCRVFKAHYGISPSQYRNRN